MERHIGDTRTKYITCIHNLAIGYFI